MQVLVWCECICVRLVGSLPDWFIFYFTFFCFIVFFICLAAFGCKHNLLPDVVGHICVMGFVLMHLLHFCSGSGKTSEDGVTTKTKLKFI